MRPELKNEGQDLNTGIGAALANANAWEGKNRRRRPARANAPYNTSQRPASSSSEHGGRISNEGQSVSEHRIAGGNARAGSSLPVKFGQTGATILRASEC